MFLSTVLSLPICMGSTISCYLMAKRLLLVRHGERIDLDEGGRVAWEDKGRRFDPPITSRGEEQARLAAATLNSSKAFLSLESLMFISYFVWSLFMLYSLHLSLFLFSFSRSLSLSVFLFLYISFSLSFFLSLFFSFSISLFLFLYISLSFSYSL
jgi:hypothetical protein